MRIRCAHGDIHKYPIVPVEIIFKGKKHRIKTAIHFLLKYPLILGTDWLGFDNLVRQCVLEQTQHVSLCGICAALSGGLTFYVQFIFLLVFKLEAPKQIKK